MQIEVKGRNLPVTDELREHVTRRFGEDRQAGERAGGARDRGLQGAQPGQPRECQVAEATLHLKGVTLRAKDASRDLNHAVNLVADELGRQVKRHRDKRRKRREQRAAAAAPPEAAGGQLPAM